MDSTAQSIVLKDLFGKGYDFCKLLPDNAPGQDLIPTDIAPTYLLRGEEAIVVYHDGSTETYKPVFKPQPPHNGPPMFD